MNVTKKVQWNNLNDKKNIFKRFYVKFSNQIDRFKNYFINESILNLKSMYFCHYEFSYN